MCVKPGLGIVLLKITSGDDIVIKQTRVTRDVIRMGTVPI